MKNYDNYSSGFFEVTNQELEKLQEIKCTKENFKEVIFHFKTSRFLDVIDYKAYAIPEKMRRNNWDSAILVAVKLKDKILAKRHNNSQYLKIK